MNKSANFNVWVLMAILLCGFALYLSPLQSKSFYFDDHSFIENNNDVIKAIDIPKIFNAFNTRSLVGLSFALNYKLSGLHPGGYHTVNLLIHCLNAFLVYLLIKATLYLYSTSRPMFFCRLEWPAFFASMLFLCHPIQTEPVNFITQRFVLMGTFFYLLTLFLYVQYRCRSQKRFLIAGIFAAIAAMFCKEFVVTLPVMMALYDFYFLNKETLWKRCRSLAPFFVIIFIVPLLLLRTPAQAIGVANIAESHGDITRARNSVGRQAYFLTELNVVCTYIRLMVLPVNQNLDYDYPISHHVDAKTALSGIFLLCLLVLAIMTYQPYRLISFGILWFFIALSVESSFIPIGDVITEYRPYLASVGFVSLLTSLIYMRRVDVRILNVIAVAILAGFSILTFQRNKVWKDEFTLWNDTVQKSPHKARTYNNRGFFYDKQGNFTQALSDYSKAIEIDPKYAQAYYNRGTIYFKQGNLAQAVSDYNKTIEIDPKYAGAYNNRGNIYEGQGKLAQALSDYNKTVELDPNYAEAYNNRGVIYTKLNNFTQAIFNYDRTLELDPKKSEAYNNRGNTYDKQGNLSQAISDYNKAIDLNPQYVQAYYDRGLVYVKQGGYTQALSDYDKAIELSPSYAQVYYSRSFIDALQGRITQAMSDCNKAIELNPQYAESYYNRGLIYNKLGNFNQAILDFNKVIELKPDYADVYQKDAQAYYNRGFMYNKQGNYSQAMSDFNKAIELDPKLVEAYFQRGNVDAQQNNFTQAILAYTQAIKVNPRFAPTYNNRAIAYYQLKEYDNSRADVHQAQVLGYKVNPQLVKLLSQVPGGGQ